MIVRNERCGGGGITDDGDLSWGLMIRVNLVSQITTRRGPLDALFVFWVSNYNPNPPSLVIIFLSKDSLHRI